MAVLHGGVLQQVGTPEDLYERPATRFVATFVGRASVLPGVLEGDGAVWVPHPALGGGRPARCAGPRRVLPRRRIGPGEEVDLVVRPESLAFVAGSDPRALPAGSPSGATPAR